MIDVSDIEKRIDRAIAAPTPVNVKLGGVALENLGQVMEFAKLMAVSGIAVPKWLRNNPGGCLAICSRALRWQMDPFAVAEKSYMAIGKGGQEHIGYEAQLIHAVITAHAPLKGRLRSEIIGTGDERRCKVWGTFKGETKPHEYTSETLGKKIAAIGTNDKGILKGSPLWIDEPEVQLTYSAVRQWCRLHSSETLLGVYTPDEFAEAAPMPSQTEILAQRLRDAKREHGERGFDVAHIAKVIEGEVTNEAEDDANPEGNVSETKHDRRRRDASHGPDDVDHQRVGARRGKGDQDVGAQPAGRKEAPQRRQAPDTKQGEIFPEDRPKPDRRPQAKGRRR